MSIGNLISIIVAFTLGLTACSKDPSGGSHATTDLGIVQVSDGETTVHDLGNGKICSMTSSVSKDGTIVLQMVVTRDGKVISRPRIQTKSGVGVGIETGEVNVALTPVVKK